jgi:hypothetical protein
MCLTIANWRADVVRADAHRAPLLAGISNWVPPADTGYSDQARPTREFVRFAGLSPRAGLAAEFGSHKPGSDWARQPGTAGGYVVTSDPDALFERVVRRGAEVVRPLGDTDYGSREFALRDPEGNMWSFGSYCGQPMPT